MSLSNFERMIRMAEEVFDARNDENQLNVDASVLTKLRALHPATISEYSEGDGPLVWILLIPSSFELMQAFLKGNIGEQELLDGNKPGDFFDTLYLCSAMVLPEYRQKGIAKKMCLEAITEIRKMHPIKSLFVWPFTKEGNKLAESIAVSATLPLLKREISHSAQS